ncbi:MAG: formyltransferase family protein [Gammaproteobacteria bacterium]|jgi:methionyl-tRNA formyltransferase
MKITYCGYDFFHACLEELLVAGMDVYRVFTVPCDNRVNFNQYIYQLCEKYKIPVSEELITEDTIEQLQTAGCELLISAAYNYKIPSLSATRIKGINIHPTLLPIGRGVWPLPWTILTDQKQSGVSIHKLTEEYDAGDILIQRSFPVAPDERLESLSAKVQLLARNMILDVALNFEHYWGTAVAQSGDIIIWNYPPKEQRTLSWEKNVGELDRICRAFGKFGCFATFENNNWTVYGLSAWEQSHNFTIGSVVHKTNTEMIVAARDGLVSLLYFEPDLT